ncbi:DUF881 domain-containing protein [Peptococcaceae bacterium 1198_IL3148]
MKSKNYYWPIVIVAIVFGIMLAFQFKTQEHINDPTIERTTQLNAEIEQKKKKVAELKEQVDEMRLTLEKAASQPELSIMQSKLKTVGIMAGTTPVKGPGIEVTLNDSNIALSPDQNPNLYVLHDEDVLKVLNELKAAGAEALALNDQRLIATSEIRCVGPTILTNGNKRLAVPFVITAIGNPDTLYNSLFMKGGVAEHLKYWGIQISAKRVAEVVIPSYNGSITYEFIQEGEGTGA